MDTKLNYFYLYKKIKIHVNWICVKYICNDLLYSYLGTALLLCTGFRSLILPRRRWPGQPDEPPQNGCLLNSRYILVLFIMLLIVVMSRLTPLEIRGVEDCQLTTQVVERQFFIGELWGEFSREVSTTNWSLCSN